MLKKIPTIKKKYVNEWLLRQKTYTYHQRTLHNFKRSKFVSRYIDEFWQADLVFIKKESSQNHGYNYLLMVIDVLSKYGWIEKLKNKKPISIVNAFQNIFKKGRVCKNLTTDAGTEFNNNLFSKFLQINHL
jgi:IS30 family transposase